MLEGGAAFGAMRLSRRARLYLQTGLYALMIAGLAGTAGAQTATVPAPPAASDKKAPAKADDTTQVTVTAQKPLNRIDRQVYDNTKDPDSQTGTAADALNKVPGVNVDPDGSVTLRGRSPQILINGKPSPMMSGDNRAAALLAMPSGSIASIEVINNPGAQFGNDSNGAGIINIVTRTTLPPGHSGSVTAQATSTGGASATVFFNAHAGKFSYTGFLTARDDTRDTRAGSVRQALNANGDVMRGTESASRSTASTHYLMSNNSLEYDPSAADSLTAQFNYSRNSNHNHSLSDTAIYDTAGDATDLYTQTGMTQYASDTQTLEGSWDHVGKKPGETLKVDAQASRTLTNTYSPNLSLYSLSSLASNLAGRQFAPRGKTKADNERFSVDYTTPIGNDQLNTGLQIIRDGSDSLNQSFGPDPASATTLTHNTLFDNAFVYSQVVSAAYITYQKPFGIHWTVLAGLRAENFELHADAVTAQMTNHVEYTTYNPSLFATYVISDKARVRLSYSHRLQRPTAQDYNPATILLSQDYISVGRANLKPQTTDSYETGYEYSDKTTSWSLRGYYTHEAGMIISVSSFVADPLNLGNLVISTARLNAGTRDTTGTEFAFSRKFTPQWSLNMNANLSNVDFRTPNFVGNPSVTGLSGRVSMTYKTKSAKDSVQVGYNLQPRLLTGQGYRSGYGMATLSYSHDLTPKVAVVLAVNDILRTSKTVTLTDTRTYYGNNYRSNNAPVFTLSLRTRFGGSFVAPKVLPTGMTVTRSPG